MVALTDQCHLWSVPYSAVSYSPDQMERTTGLNGNPLGDGLSMTDENPFQ